MRKLENTRDLQQWVREREQHIIVLSGPLLATSGIIAGLQHVNEGCQCEGKKCTKCEDVKCIGTFYRHRKRLKSKCKVCVGAENKAYYHQNKEQEIARSMAYQVAHPEQKEKRKRWRAKNAEHIKAYSRWYGKEHAEQIEAYRKAHPEKAVARVRRCVKRYPDRVNARQAVCRMQKTQAGGAYTAQEWRDLKAFYSYTCLCCKRKEPDIKLTADHVIPVVKGGSSFISNIQPLCQSCNSRKGLRIIDYRVQVEREA